MWKKNNSSFIPSNKKKITSTPEGYNLEWKAGLLKIKYSAISELVEVYVEHSGN